MITIHQMEEKGNEMATAHLPKPGLCSPAATPEKYPDDAPALACLPRRTGNKKCDEQRDIFSVGRICFLGSNLHEAALDSQRQMNRRRRRRNVKRMSMLATDHFIPRRRNNVGSSIAGVLQLAILFVSCQTTFGYGYEVEGDLRVKNFFKGEILSELHFLYVVSVSDGFWSIDSTDDTVRSKDGIGMLRRIVAGTDGSDVYSFAVISADTNSPSSNPMSQASITAGLRPTFDPNLQLIWLAFASADYLSKGADLGNKPPWVTDKRMLNPCIIRAQKSSASPFLPERVFYFDGNGSPTGLVDHVLATNSQPLLGEYSVSVFTNLNGLTIPIEFELKRFKLEPISKKSEQSKKVISIYHGAVRRISFPVPKVSFLPSLPKAVVSTLDYRFADPKLKIESLRYEIADQHWPESDAPLMKKLDQLERKKASFFVARTQPKAASSLTTVSVRVALLGLLVFPIIFVLWSKTKKMKG